MTLVDLLDNASKKYLGKTVFVCNEKRVTYQEFQLRCENLASHLSKLGTKKGDRVAIILFNSIELWIRLKCQLESMTMVARWSAIMDSNVSRRLKGWNLYVPYFKK